MVFLMRPVVDKDVFCVAEKVGANYTYDWDIKKKKDGKEYVTVTKSKLLFEPEKLTIQLDNLFNGNKLLGKSTTLPQLSYVTSMPSQEKYLALSVEKG
jgi:Haemolymph juvenile hormone binding protein (JHBP).